MLWSITFSGALLLAVAGIVGAKRGRMSDSPPAERDLSLASLSCCVLLACLIRFGLLFMLSRRGNLIFDPDEQFRYITAVRWSHHPTFFNVWNGIWQPGCAAYFGLWMKLLGGRSHYGFLMGLLTGHMMNIAVTCWLAVTVTRRRISGAVAALALAPAYLFMWYGLGPVAEVNLATAAMLAAGFGWRCLRVGGDAGRAAWREAVFFGAALAATALIHLQGWFFLALLGAVFLPAYWALGLHRRPGGLVRLAFILFCFVAVPLAWMWGSWLNLGGPLAFLHSIKLNMEEERRKWGLAFKASDLLIYPGMVWRQAGLLLPAAAAGWAVSRGEMRRAALGLAGLGLGFMLIMDFTGFLSRFIVPLNDRFMLLPVCFIFAGCGAAMCAFFEPLLRGARFNWRLAGLWLGLALIAAPWLARNTAKGFEYSTVTQLSGWPNDILSLTHWMHRERANPQLIHGLGRDTKIGVLAGQGSAEWSLLTMYLTGDFEQIYPLTREAIESGGARHEKYEILMINQDAPAKPKGYRHVTQLASWDVYQVEP